MFVPGNLSWTNIKFTHLQHAKIIFSTRRARRIRKVKSLSTSLPRLADTQRERSQSQCKSLWKCSYPPRELRKNAVVSVMSLLTIKFCPIIQNAKLFHFIQWIKKNNFDLKCLRHFKQNFKSSESDKRLLVIQKT